MCDQMPRSARRSTASGAVALLLAILPGAALAADPATEPAGAESPQALVARMNAAQAEGDFGTIVNCIEPKGRTELTSGLLGATVMMVAFSGAFDEMAGAMGEAVTGEEPSAEQQQAIEAAQEAAAQKAEELNRRLARILKEHGLPDLTDENAPLPEGGPEELLAKIDQGALVNDLMELMASLGGEQDENPAAELPVPKEVTGYRIDGDRAEARAGDEPVHFVRIDGRWFLEDPEADDTEGTTK